MSILEQGHGMDRRRSSMERHIQTILTVSIAGLMAWQLSTIEAMRVDLAVLTGRVDALAARVDEATTDRYRTTDARRDFALRDQVIQGLEGRIDRVEGICADIRDGMGN